MASFTSSGNDCDFGEDPGTSDISFSPPVSEQRYQAAVELVKEFQPKKVVDMGCGPCSIIRRLKWHHCIQELVEVDVDCELLKSRAHLGNPIMADYLNPRENPFVVRLYKGSIGQFDDRMTDCDLLICIEVIEHLFEEDLSRVPAVVFGNIRPRRALFTTPNSEFNVLFKNKTERFRHPDHKFEWTRQEFVNWCSSICDKYGYKVQYLGMGAGPEGTEQYGCCTQGAVFTADDGRHHTQGKGDFSEETANVTKQTDSQPYEMVSEIVHPFKPKDSISLEQRIEWEVERCMQDALTSSADELTTEDHDDNGRLYLMPLEKLIRYPSLNKLCSSDIETLRSGLMASRSLNLSEDGSVLLYKEPEDETEESSSESDEEDDLPLVCTNQEEEEEDWDAD